MVAKKFTILELLLVIAVIVILASLLLPALKRAKESAKQISCSSQLRQFGYAVSSYVSSNSEWLPYSTTNGKLWDYLLMPDLNYNSTLAEANQIRQYSLFHCPAGSSENYFNAVQYRSRGYAYNYNCTSSALGIGVKVSKVRNPPALPILSDSSYGSAQQYKESITFASSSQAAYVDSSSYGNFSYRHSGRLNLLFADMHVMNNSKGTYITSESNWVPQNTNWFNN